MDRVTKLVVPMIEILANTGTKESEDLEQCDCCGSLLMYSEMEYGLVKPAVELQVPVSKLPPEPKSALRVVGLKMWCAECGTPGSAYDLYDEEEIEYVFCDLDEARLNRAVEDILSAAFSQRETSPNPESVAKAMEPETSPNPESVAKAMEPKEKNKSGKKKK